MTYDLDEQFQATQGQGRRSCQNQTVQTGERKHTDKWTDKWTDGRTDAAKHFISLSSRSMIKSLSHTRKCFFIDGSLILDGP